MAMEPQNAVDLVEKRGIRHPGVLRAMRNAPRAEFVPEDLRHAAEGDHPLPIGYGATISQPYVVALMTELLDPQPQDRVLEIGTGCGYQTAVLAPLVAHVDSVEVVPELAADAARRLTRLGYTNVTVHQGDGYQGWPEQAPYDRVILTAAPPEVPDALFAQLRPGGRLVSPVGRAQQDLVVWDKDANGGLRARPVIPVQFVPMVPASAGPSTQ